MLVTVKSREAQRGMLAEMSGQSSEAAQHYLAAAHLELVLAVDYERAGEPELARRSRMSAASCLWRAGRRKEAQTIFTAITKTDPASVQEVQEVIEDLKSAGRS
jgi:hypothetical protein